jgi:hypothetical protein
MAEPMDLWRVVARNFVAGVLVEGRSVTAITRAGAPILAKFHGQPFANLQRWCRARGFRLEKVEAAAPAAAPGENG